MSRLARGSVLIAMGTVVTLVFAIAAIGAPAATTITVTAGKPTELAFTFSKKTSGTRAIVFKVTNRGKLSHDLKIAGKKTRKLLTGKSATLNVTFAKAGRYAYLCTLPGHAAGGMKGTFVVK